MLLQQVGCSIIQIRGTFKSGDAKLVGRPRSSPRILPEDGQASLAERVLRLSQDSPDGHSWSLHESRNGQLCWKHRAGNTIFDQGTTSAVKRHQRLSANSLDRAWNHSGRSIVRCSSHSGAIVLFLVRYTCDNESHREPDSEEKTRGVCGDGGIKWTRS